MTNDKFFTQKKKRPCKKKSFSKSLASQRSCRLKGYSLVVEQWSSKP